MTESIRRSSSSTASSSTPPTEPCISTMETRVLVRVQAKGGKFIGPDGGYALVTLREVVSGEILAQRIATGGSGNLSATFTPGATREVIVTPGASGDTVQWLSAPAGQSTAG